MEMIANFRAALCSASRPFASEAGIPGFAYAVRRSRFALRQIRGAARNSEPVDDDTLLAELGVVADDAEGVSALVHVRPRAEIRAAEEIANRTACKDLSNSSRCFSGAKGPKRACARRDDSDRRGNQAGRVFHPWRSEGLYRRGRGRISHRTGSAQLPVARHLR